MGQCPGTAGPVTMLLLLVPTLSFQHLVTAQNSFPAFEGFDFTGGSSPPQFTLNLQNDQTVPQQQQSRPHPPAVTGSLRQPLQQQQHQNQILVQQQFGAFGAFQ